MNEKEINQIITRIKNRRIEMGLSYQDMQDLTGISKSTWQRYETGFIKNLGIDKLDIVAKALKTTPAYLMGWEKQEDMKPSQLDTIAAHLEGKDITPQKMKLLEKYIDALFDEEFGEE